MNAVSNLFIFQRIFWNSTDLETTFNIIEAAIKIKQR